MSNSFASICGASPSGRGQRLEKESEAMQGFSDRKGTEDPSKHANISLIEHLFYLLQEQVLHCRTWARPADSKDRVGHSLTCLEGEGMYLG